MILLATFRVKKSAIVGTTLGCCGGDLGRRIDPHHRPTCGATSARNSPTLPPIPTTNDDRSTSPWRAIYFNGTWIGSLDSATGASCGLDVAALAAPFDDERKGRLFRQPWPKPFAAGMEPSPRSAHWEPNRLTGHERCERSRNGRHADCLTARPRDGGVRAAARRSRQLRPLTSRTRRGARWGLTP